MRGALAQGKSFFKKIYLTFIERQNLAGATAIHFTVPQEEIEYREQGLPVTKSIVIPNSVDAIDVESLKVRRGTFRKKMAIPDGARVILFFSRIDPKKGFDTLLPACAEVIKKEPQATLVIVGAGEEAYVRELKREVERLGMSAHVRFVGHLDGEEKYSACIDSDVFVLPSYSENFGMAVVEAMQCGTPIVITESVGIARDVTVAKAGLVIPKTIEAVSNAIASVFDDSAGSRERAIRAQVLVAKLYAPATVAEQFIAAYTEIATARRG
jgi:glycosyltransferase involved in cell wall biosynthesis